MPSPNNDPVRSAQYGIGEFFADLNALSERVARLENHQHRTDHDALRRFTTTPLTEDGKVYDSYITGYQAGFLDAKREVTEALEKMGNKPIPAAHNDGSGAAG